MSKYLFSIYILLTVYVITVSWADKDKPTTIWMVGDSTMSIKDANKYPETGWGVPFSTFFQKHVQVKNHAANGRSTKSFVTEMRWKNVVDSLSKGDYVFIQFGHNDEKVEKPLVGTSIDEYKINLSDFVRTTRAKNAIPVLLTPIARRKFAGGVLQETHGAYPDAVRTVADSLDVILIDVTKITNNLLQEMGESASKKLFLHLNTGHHNYPEGVQDNTHLNEKGAEEIAKLVMEDLKKQGLPLAKLFRAAL